MELHVVLADNRDLAGQIYGQIRAAILSGNLGPGEALPPSRELSAQLAVSRTTVSVAYDRLGAEGIRHQSSRRGHVRECGCHR